jgi:hypothetical protein
VIFSFTLLAKRRSTGAQGVDQASELTKHQIKFKSTSQYILKVCIKNVVLAVSTKTSNNFFLIYNPLISVALNYDLLS